MKASLSILFALMLSSLALAAEGRNVSYKSGEETVQAEMYTPAGPGPFPGLVVIHEWWGLNEWVKEQADKLADHGYLTLAIDLYRGKVANTAEEAHELMRGVSEDRSARDLKAAFNYLASQKNVRARRVGVIGWCMGGGYALQLAIEEPKLAAAVINYGHLADERSTLEKIHAPILGIFGAQDRGIKVDDVKKFEQQLKQLGKSVDIVIYPDAGHAFENPNNKDGYRAQDAADAWTRILEFMHKTLKR